MIRESGHETFRSGATFQVAVKKVNFFFFLFVFEFLEIIPATYNTSKKQKVT